MILLGLGANLQSKAGPPEKTFAAALADLSAAGVRIVARSRWYRTPPDPPSAQPWYLNGVVMAETALDPVALLDLLHRIEAKYGRVRGRPNAARPLDLDLLDYDGLVRKGPGAPILPHPRLDHRAFVLQPLADVAPGWRHPGNGRTVGEMLAAMPREALSTLIQDIDLEPKTGP